MALMRPTVVLLLIGAIAHADSSVGDAKRDPLQICERYRKAMEARDVPTLIALAHPRYHETAGTPSPDDDYDYEGLKAILTTRFRAVKEVKLKLTYRKVTVDGGHARVEVQQEASFLIGERWVKSQDNHNIELERDGKRWLIIGGM